MDVSGFHRRYHDFASGEHQGNIPRFLHHRPGGIGPGCGTSSWHSGGFVIGLVQDLSNPAVLGLHALCKCTLGFSLGSLRSRLVHGMPVVEAVVVALAVILHDLIFLLVQSRLTDEGFLRPFLTQSLPVALYSGVAGILVIRLADLAGILGQED